MRPVPRSRHVPAVLLLVTAAAATSYIAMRDDRLSDGQKHAGTVAMKLRDPDLFGHDAVFGPSGLWRFHVPVFQAMMAPALRTTKYQDASAPFRAAAGPVALIYLLGMYALLFRQTRNWSVSVFVAIVSLTVTYALAGSFWGTGALESIQPAGLCTAAVPWIVLAFVQYWRDWRVLPVFAAVGALGNLDPVAAMNLAIVLLIVLLAIRRFSLRAWPVAIACCAVAFIVSGPLVWRDFALQQSLTSPGAGAVGVETIHQVIKIAQWELLYPELLRSAVNWPLVLLLVVLPATVIQYRVERYPIRQFALWVWMIAAVLFVTFGLQGLSQLIGVLRQTRPPILLFAQASGLVMLPLYVLFSQMLTSIFRLTRRHRSMVRWACGAFAAVWIIPAGNFRVARYAALEAATMFMDESAKPTKVMEHREKLRRHKELVEMGLWARGTDRGAVFLFDNIEFRMISRRSIVASQDDLGYFYYRAPWRLKEWAGNVLEQSRLLHPAGTADIGEIRQFVSDLAGARHDRTGARQASATTRVGAQGRFDGVTEWYVVLPVRQPTQGRLANLSPVYSGQFYQVYKLDAPGRADEHDSNVSARKDKQ